MVGYSPLLEVLGIISLPVVRYASAVESNIMQTCNDIVHTCVATGSYRPSLVLFVELACSTSAGSNQFPDELALKNEIIRRIAPAQVKMWAHEMILDPRQIRVVPGGTMPRTGSKGNVKRKAVEAMFKEELDELYEAMEEGKGE